MYMYNTEALKSSDLAMRKGAQGLCRVTVEGVGKEPCDN